MRDSVGLVARGMVLFLCVGSLTACVPYPKFQESEKKLAVATKVNRDLENRLKSAGVELAAALGGEGMRDMTLEALRAQLEGLRQENGTLEDEIALLRDELSNVPELPAAGPGFTPEDEDRVRGSRLIDGDLVIESDLLFAPGKVALKGQAKKALDDLAALITSKYSDRVIHLSGHTDNTPIRRSGHKDNWDLGMKRAHSVFKYLVQKGVPEVNMRLHSFGYSKPFADVDPNSKQGRSASRRVEVHLGMSKG